MDLSFLKKIVPSTGLSFDFLSKRPSRVVGIDVGTHSTKVIELRYEKERGILETYGELRHDGYFKENNPFVSFVHRQDAEVAALIKDILRESNVLSKDAVFSVPAGTSFITTIPFPAIPESEIKSAIPFEARRYVPIPIAEVTLDWEVIGQNEARDRTDVLLMAIPNQVLEKIKRISGLVGLKLRGVEIETFGMLRSLMINDLTCTLFINLGHQTTSFAIADRGQMRLSYNLGKGSHELTRMLEQGLGVNRERATILKHQVGISEKIEEKEITSIIVTYVETLFAEIDRIVSIYNRKAPRTVQRINITGGGSNLKGLIEYIASKFGVEVTRGNPFARVVTPAFLQSLLREVGPSFSIATGLALREIVHR